MLSITSGDTCNIPTIGVDMLYTITHNNFSTSRLYTVAECIGKPLAASGKPA